MKKISKLLIIMLLLTTLVACSNKTETTNEYCSSCGNEITSDFSFCGNCGAAVKDNKEYNSTTDNNETTTLNDVTQVVNPPSETQKTEETQNKIETQKPIETENSHETQKNVETKKPFETQKPVETQKNTETNKPVHTHSYSKKVTVATCTEKGYTTYTCSCGASYIDNQTSAKGHSYTAKTTKPTCTEKGYTTYTCACGYSYKDNYTNSTHTYIEYICHSCGAIDKTSAYKYLVEYVKTNGTANGSYVSITMSETNGKKYELKYDAQNQCLWATSRESTSSAVLTTTLSIEDGFYGLNYVYNASITSDLTGFIDPKTFNENSPMTYDTFTGLENTKITMLNLARSGLVLTIVEMEKFFDTHNINLNVYALGYTGLQ